MSTYWMPGTSKPSPLLTSLHSVPTRTGMILILQGGERPPPPRGWERQETEAPAGSEFMSLALCHLVLSQPQWKPLPCGKCQRAEPREQEAEPLGQRKSKGKDGGNEARAWACPQGRTGLLGSRGTAVALNPTPGWGTWWGALPGSRAIPTLYLS